MPDLTWLDPRHRDYSWRFNESELDDRDAFVAAFVAYNEELETEGASVDFLLLNASAAIVRFSGVPEEGSDYEDMEVEVRTDLGEPLRFWDFMYRLHSLVFPYLADADHVFFEGLSFQEMRDGVPVFRLEQGS